MKFCVLNCDNSKAWQEVSFGHMFQSHFCQEGDEWIICNVDAGEPIPDDVRDFDGLVITGSRRNCRERENIPWFDEVCELIRTGYNTGSPRVFGGCFGCQIIAHALGGKVDYNPGNRFHLRAETIKPCASSENFYKQLSPRAEPKEMVVLKSHGDCVHELPPNSVHLASSETCKHELFLVGKSDECFNILGCQSHPEFDLQHCVWERIWPAVTGRNRLHPNDIEASKRSLEEFTSDAGAYDLLHLISDFLHCAGATARDMTS